jgi:hypothetical protein
MIYIDTFTLSSLVLLNLYDNGITGARGYDIYEFSYGNLASTMKITPPTTNYYIDFTPPNSNPSTFPNALDWTYIDTSSGTSSVFTFYSYKTGVTNNYITGTHTISGINTVLTSSLLCKVVFSSPSTYRVITLATSGNTITSTPLDISLAVNALSTSKILWKISDDCNFLLIDTSILKLSSGTYQVINSNLNVVAIDSSFTYALVGNAIYKYSSTTNTFSSYKTGISANFIGNSELFRSTTRIILLYKNTNSLYLNAFTDVNGTLTLAH